ncbi:sigma-70 family RNA polymerase sigma factor [Lentzea albida]|uniref:sigma-70 family RNA polymerase sigma factor n=1 Tax=Lentzea albida TaxID=65499 RepID=UPI0015A62E85|nr:RNA polymerase sigma factor RpoD/SigA [Lentzea albida]
MTGTDPKLVDGFSVDLWEFRELLRRDYVRPQSNRSLIVVQGQQLPADFYTLLRLLDVATTVLVDPHQMVDESGSTLPEILDCFGLPSAVQLPAGKRTKAGVVLADALGTRRLSAAQDENSTSDDVSVLAGHRSVEDEADFVAELAYEDPGSQIGLLLPTADLVETFVDLIRTRFDGTIQWYLSRVPTPHEERVDSTTPGIKILTWASGAGLKFDQVVLGSLDQVTSEALFDSTLRTLGCSARDRLLLSYTGQGEPTMLARLPRQLLQVKTAPRTSDPLAAPQIQAAAVPVLTPVPTVAPPAMSGGVADVAREVIEADRLDPENRRRVLTALEEVELALLIRANEYALNEELPRGFRSTLDAKDPRARAFDAFVGHNTGLIHSNISRYRGNGLDDDDLYQHGVIGLMRAVEKFDGSRGLKFSTYATHWINQAMSRAIACEGALIRLPVHVHEVVRKVLATYRTLDRLGIASTVAEVAHRTEMSPADVVKHLQYAAGTVSLDAPLASGEDLCLADIIPADFEATNPDSVLERQDGQALVHKALSLLKPREADVLRHRFGFHSDEPQTLEQIGTQFGVTRERIRQIEGRAKQSLRGKLNEVGLVSTDTNAASSPAVPAPAGPARRVRTRTSNPSPSHLEVRRNELASGTHLEDRLGTRSGSSIAELVVEFVDQAVRAGAQKVSVQSAGTGATAFLTLAHNGFPFMNQRLHDIFLERGSRSALHGDALAATAMSLYDELITWEATAASEHRCFVLTCGRTTGSWWIGRGLGSPPATTVGPAQPSAVVVLRSPRPQVARMPVREVLIRLEDQLGTVFGELLDGGLSVSLDSRKLTSRDPFLWANPAAQHLGEETVTAGEHTVRVSPRVLPHPSLLHHDDHLAAGEPDTWSARQGFYLRCEGRLVSLGGWLGLCVPTPDSSLARVLIDVAADDRGAWGLNDPSDEVSPPPALRPRLTALAHLAMQRSKLVVDRHRTEPAQ